MKKKKCSKCNEIKLVSEFGKRKTNKDGLRYICKSCCNLISNKYNRTKKGLISRIYGSQRAKSKHRGHQPPIYTKQQFSDFCFASPMFHKLFDKWVESGYDKWFAPSFDRADDYKCYSFDNFNKWMTWKGNNDKGNTDMRNGKLIHGNKPQKAVIGTHKVTGEVIKFCSMREAERQTGIFNNSISKCCSGKQKSAGGYVWKYNN